MARRIKPITSIYPKRQRLPSDSEGMSMLIYNQAHSRLRELIEQADDLDRMIYELKEYMAIEDHDWLAEHGFVSWKYVDRYRRLLKSGK